MSEDGGERSLCFPNLDSAVFFDDVSQSMPCRLNACNGWKRDIAIGATCSSSFVSDPRREAFALMFIEARETRCGRKVRHPKAQALYGLSGFHVAGQNRSGFGLGMGDSQSINNWRSSLRKRWQWAHI